MRVASAVTVDYATVDGGSATPGVDYLLTSGTLTCALHLSRFDLENGEPLDPPAEIPLAVYTVVVEDGRVVIEVPDGPLPINE